MMSPLSIAEYLAPGVVHFDLLVMDEASQIEPVDALGAAARVDQVVVVGDDRQLPPTPFFRGRLVDDSDDDEATTADLESILGLCAAQGIPQRILRWHYRSRHQSLIAVSNREFYGDRLLVVPSPFIDNPELGLTFRYLPDGVYDRGGTRENKAEAISVAQAAIEHARHRPDLSLGIGCFSVSQRDAILQELELLWRHESDVRDFFAAGGAEPFFVKNLENIQGDERDVIFVSVGYGRDASGYFAMSFGPLNVDGGERRLNVLITRARRRLEVFSSIIADDIDLDRAPRRGVAALKSFLHYAQTGVLGMARPTGRDFDSPFEEQVADALQGLGYRLDAQVGVAGFFVDLAVHDPDRSGRYLLGIECDGAAYHSARSARDRDRLRQQVLEDQGWLIHRIWSGDWFRKPELELRRAVAAIEAARTTWQIRDRQAAEPRSSAPPAETSKIERHASSDPAVETETLAGAGAYVEADFSLPGSPEPHLLDNATMLDALKRIVEIEGPIHRDEIARRLTRVCGYQRTGRRIVDAVNRGLTRATRTGIVVREGEFFSLADATEPEVRDRTAVSSQTCAVRICYHPLRSERR